MAAFCLIELRGGTRSIFFYFLFFLTPNRSEKIKRIIRSIHTAGSQQNAKKQVRQILPVLRLFFWKKKPKKKTKKFQKK